MRNTNLREATYRAKERNVQRYMHEEDGIRDSGEMSWPAVSSRCKVLCKMGATSLYVSILTLDFTAVGKLVIPVPYCDLLARGFARTWDVGTIHWISHSRSYRRVSILLRHTLLYS